MSEGFRRRWAELAPLRQSVMIHFAGPKLRRWVEKACEEITERALEFEQGAGYGEPFVLVGARAAVADLWHTQQTLCALAATPRFAQVSDRELSICQDLATLAADLELRISDLDRKLGPPPPELATMSLEREAN